MKQHSRPRPFVALTRNNRREIVTASSPQPTKKYIVTMVGPFKTFRGARFYRDNTWLFARNINQVERMAKETE